MALDVEGDPFFSKVLAGLPRIAELIATVPEHKRPQALDAARQSYFKTACEFGYGTAEAQDWAAAVMSHLRLEGGREPEVTR